MLIKKAVLGTCLLSHLLLCACATKPENISASYVSPLQYQSYNCNQVRMELTRVSRRVSEIAGVQNSQATKDAVALGVGLVVFWPALFFMIGKDKEEELSRLKGEFEALEQTAIEKECDVAQEMDAAKKLEQERLTSQEVEKEKKGLND